MLLLIHPEAHKRMKEIFLIYGRTQHTYEHDAQDKKHNIIMTVYDYVMCTVCRTMGSIYIYIYILRRIMCVN